MGQITPLQLWMAALLPTIFSIGSLTVAIVGVLVSNGRFASMDSRFSAIENRLTAIEVILGDLRERVKALEHPIIR